MADKKAKQEALFEGAPADTPEKPSSVWTTRELWRFVRYYQKNIRPTPQSETVGVIRNIQRMLDKGIQMEEIAIALKNYENDEWRKSQDPRFSKPLRSFFTAENIKLWQTPREIKKLTRGPRIPVVSVPAASRPRPVEVQPEEEIDDL